MTLFPPTRADGLARLATFVPRAGRSYAENRNADAGPGDRDNVSVLSPYLRYRLISEREVVEAVLDRHGPRTSEKFVQEVLWRTYWKGWLEMRPAVWERFEADRDAARVEVARSSGFTKVLAQAEAGGTGIDGFDHWARELVEHGYLHNHARMWFASIWIFTLRLPWALGADFFLRHLIDADPASNTLSWRWVAGLQTAGKTYLATAGNIARYTGGRFEPQGLATRAEPLIEPPLPTARALPSPEPLNATAPALLLITGEDLSPETAIPHSLQVRSALASRTVNEAWPFGPKASAFVSAAAEDATTRAEAHFGCPASLADTLDAVALIELARNAGAQQIVTAYAPVGPVATALERLAPELAAAGLPLTRVRRSWDEQFWPYATKGYFALRSRIPEGLAAEGLAA